MLTDLRATIEAQLDELEGDREVQLTLDFDLDEREQFRRDVDALRRRLDDIPAEIEREQDAIRRRYADPVPRLFPAAVTFLLPPAIAHGSLGAVAMTPHRRPRTSVAGVHADWLRLVEPNGPFLTLPVLRRVWPERPRPPRRRRPGRGAPPAGRPRPRRSRVGHHLGRVGAHRPARLRARLQSGPQVPATLAHVVAEHGAVLRPDHALDDGTGHPRLLVTVHPPSTRLDARPAGDRWSATPIERLALLCRATGVELGLATNALTWTLVWAPKGSASGTATFSAELFSEEPVLLDAFTSVLGARRFFAVAEPRSHRSTPRRVGRPPRPRSPASSASRSAKPSSCSSPP